MSRKAVGRLGPCPRFLMSQRQCLSCSLSSSFHCCGSYSSSLGASSYVFMLLLQVTVHAQESPQLHHSMVRSRLEAHLGHWKVQQSPWGLLAPVTGSALLLLPSLLLRQRTKLTSRHRNKY